MTGQIGSQVCGYHRRRCTFFHPGNIIYRLTQRLTRMVKNFQLIIETGRRGQRKCNSRRNDPAEETSSVLTSILGRVSAGEHLSMEEMSHVIDLVMQGECSDEQIGLLLMALRTKGETISEIAGAAAAMRKHMVPIRSSHKTLVDTCGTGGAGLHTFNISTAAALVAAASGTAVAKHGNRKITSQTGSADVLVELGVNIEAPVEIVEECLQQLGICFCFAPLLHPAMKHVATVRKQLGVPTIFNLLGPLCNPAAAPNQLLGVGRPELRTTLAEALAMLGTERALVVTGADGMDELTLTGDTYVTLVENGSATEQTWTPADFGMSTADLTDLQVENPHESAERILGIFRGEPGPGRDIVVMNAAAAIWLTGQETSLEAAAQQAAAAIDDGRCTERLDQLGQLSHQA